MCWAPLVLIGYLFTMQTAWHRTPSENGTLLEVQSCERGIGVDAKASSSGLYGLGLQYGLGSQRGDWSVTLLPKAGLSYIDHPNPALPLRTQFEVGAQLLVGYQRFRIGVEYWHLSNAGLRAPNIGLDLLAIQTGWIF